MPEDTPQGGKILGMPRKVAIPVLAVAAIVVVYFLVFRRKTGGGAIPRMEPEEGGGGGFFGGGGGGGSPSLGQIVSAPPMNPWEEAMERLGFEREQFQYNIEQRRESERQKEFDIAFEEKRSTLDKFLELLPFQFETQREREAAEQAGFRAEQSRAGAEAAFFRTEEAAQNVIERSVRSKKKVECPKGEHLVVTPEGTRCQPLGGGGFNLKTVFSGIGNIAEGLFTGAAAAAPGIGYGAARYGAAQAGIFGASSRRGKQTEDTRDTREPYQFTGDPSQLYGGLA